MCPFSSPMATLRLLSITISISATSVPQNRVHLWSESVGEKATAVAASTVFITATGIHFPPWFFHIFTYSVIRPNHPSEATKTTYRLIARSCGKDVAFSRPGAIPDNPPVEFIRRDGGVLGIYGMAGVGLGFHHPDTIRDHLITFCISPPLIQPPGSVPRNAQDILIVRGTERHPRHRQRVSLQRSTHRSVIVLGGVDTDDSVGRRCRFTSRSEHSF